MNREKYLIWQYRTKPKARKTIELLFEESEKVFKASVQLAALLNIEQSSQFGLDMIGRHVGISRTMQTIVPKNHFGFLEFEGSLAFAQGEFYRSGNALRDSVVLDDENYRFLIKAKVLKNYQFPTINNINDSVRYLFGNRSFVIDNYDMSMNIVIPNTEVTSFRLYAILKLDILIRPIGVSYQFVIVNNEKPFGWDSQSFGFENGVFTRLINVNNQ